MINWKVRLRNPVFWMTIVPAAAAFVYTLLGAFDVVPAVTENDIMNFATAAVTFLTAVGVLVDPTTKGVGDSDLAMTYEAPREDD